MPDFATAYNRIVLDDRFDILAHAYRRARGELTEDEWQWVSHDRAEQDLANARDRQARELSESYECEAMRSQHEEVTRSSLDPLALCWLGHHLFGPDEIDTLAHLLAFEEQRFSPGVTAVGRGHASYAMRYAVRELEALLAKTPAGRACGRGDQQESSWLPLSRHYVRELIVRAYAAECRKGSLPLPDWDALLEVLTNRLEGDLRGGRELMVGFADLPAPSSDNDGQDEVTADDFTDESGVWLFHAQSVGSNYDRKDAEHILRLLSYVTDRAQAAGSGPLERQGHTEFCRQVRLRFAYTAYTHIVRGVTTRILEQQRLPVVANSLQQAWSAFGEVRENQSQALHEIRSRTAEAFAACSIPFAALAMRKLDAARAALNSFRKQARAAGIPLPEQLDKIGIMLDVAREASGIGPGEIPTHVLQALADCGIAESGDPDCGNALSWLRAVGSVMSFGRTFDERLARAGNAVAADIRATWDQALAERLDDFLAAAEGCSESPVRLSIGGFLEASAVWASPRQGWVDAVTETSFAEGVSRVLRVDEALILEEVDVNPAARRIDHAELRRKLALSPGHLAAWELLRDLDESYAALFALARMRRNAPRRVVKYFTAICRLAENKGTDAETTMNLEEWLATTERLFAGIEQQYFDEMLASGDEHLDLADWIDGRRGSAADAGAQALLPFFSLWQRLLVGTRPTSRAVPYLRAVRSVLRPWFQLPTASLACST